MWVKEHQASFLLRIEDIDFTRCRDIYTKQIIDDLNWMGFCFDETVLQSQRLGLYQDALNTLIHMGVLYPCFCTRKQIQHNTASSHATRLDNYPKTCLHLSSKERENKMKNQPFCWRLNTHKVQSILGDELAWKDGGYQSHVFCVQDIGDVVIGRKDIGLSYHLAVVVDDAKQGVSHVIRGEDLRSSTPVHYVLQKLLGYHHPVYIHHPLLRENHALKLSKRKQSLSLKTLREQGYGVDEVIAYIQKVDLLSSAPSVRSV